MDPFGQLPETPDLSGEVAMVSYKPVFTGPYSCVYRGKLRRGGEMVAIKVLSAVEGTALHTMRRKLNRERRTWGALHHPNILPLYGFAEDEEMFQPFGALISPWRQYGDASKFMAQHGDLLTLDQRVNLWKDVIAGVHYLHTHNPLLVHGDLKPRNVLIDDLSRAQICDFGLVRIFMEEGSTGMTTTTHHTGTERYLAYELVIAGDEAIPTTASDIYAVGCIGLEFVFSLLPYSDRKNNYGGMIYSDIKSGIPPARCPPELSSHSGALWVLLESSWSINSSARPSAASLLFEIGRISHGDKGQSFSGYNDLFLNTEDLSVVQDPDPTLSFGERVEGISLRGNSMTVVDQHIAQPHVTDMEVLATPQLDLDFSQFTPDHQATTAQRIYNTQPLYPKKLITLITSEDRKQSQGRRNNRKMRVDLPDHIRSVHFQNRPFQCILPGCSLTFIRESDLALHSKLVHINRAALICPLCLESYRNVSDIEWHMHVKHSGILASDTSPRQSVNWAHFGEKASSAPSLR